MQIVGAAIIDAGELLACRRIAPPALAGRYEFPGGKVDPDEDPRAAVVREVYEELGVQIVCEEVPVGSWPLDAGAELIIFRAYLIDARPTSSTDHDDLHWLALGTWADGVEWVDVDRAAVKRLEEQAQREERAEGEQ